MIANGFHSRQRTGNIGAVYHKQGEAEVACKGQRKRRLPTAGRAMQKIATTIRDTVPVIEPPSIRVQILLDITEELLLHVLLKIDGIQGTKGFHN